MSSNLQALSADELGEALALKIKSGGSLSAWVIQAVKKAIDQATHFLAMDSAARETQSHLDARNKILTQYIKPFGKMFSVWAPKNVSPSGRESVGIYMSDHHVWDVWSDGQMFDREDDFVADVRHLLNAHHIFLEFETVGKATLGSRVKISCTQNTYEKMLKNGLRLSGNILLLPKPRNWDNDFVDFYDDWVTTHAEFSVGRQDHLILMKCIERSGKTQRYTLRNGVW